MTSNRELALMIGRVKSNEMKLAFVKNDGSAIEINCNPRNEVDNNRVYKTAMMASVTGDKYIGIQQDNFQITVNNIPVSTLAKIVNDGYRNIIVFVKDIYDPLDRYIPVFNGQMINVTGGRPDFVTYESKFTCVRRASIFLNSLVNPYTPSSSMNFYEIISSLIPVESISSLPGELKNYKFNMDDYRISGERKTVLNDIIDLLNDRVGDYAWYDITYSPEGTINIFNAKSSKIKIYQLDGPTGLIGVPTIDANGVSFLHVYQKWMVPGAIVKIDNRYLDTTGANTAFLYTIDKDGEYVITHVKYNFSTVKGLQFTCECEAFPRSKYMNWSTK